MTTNWSSSSRSLVVSQMSEISSIGERENAQLASGFIEAGRLPRIAGLPFLIVILLIGLASGLGGMALALLLHVIQHLTYGYDLTHVAPPESFLDGVTNATPIRRIVALTLCGFVAGTGWWALGRFGRPLVSVNSSVGKTMPGPRMPFVATMVHALLQIVTVALGSPLGREVAPREVGALLATKLARLASMTPDETRIAIACGAGAGLAAVYNVPLGGAIFVVEVLLKTFAPKALISAFAASVIGSMVAWIGLGNAQPYVVRALEISPSIFVGSLAVGPACGLAAYGFHQMTTAAMRRAPDDWRRLPWSFAVFVFIGLCASLFPQLPGNGKGPAQLGFDGDLGLAPALELLLLKLVAVGLSLRAGAAGGVLTPSFAIGALVATVLAHIWNAFMPGTPNEAFAVSGAAAFLASSMAMPLTAIVLTIEFTRVNHDMWLPILIAVAGSVAMFRFCIYKETSVSSPARVTSLGSAEKNARGLASEGDRRNPDAARSEVSASLKHADRQKTF
jgi:H+/Cl- antiporter ClcA